MQYLTFSKMTYALIVALVIAVTGVNADDDTTTSSTTTSGVWWGSTDKDNDTSVRPFEIVFSDEMIEDLLYRLKNRRPIAPSMEDTSTMYGVNSEKISGWLDSWAEDYNFTARQDYFNQFAHYKVLCQGLDMHILWFKQEACEGKTILPLLLLHGWPGSFREFYDMIPYLIAVANERDYVLEIVIPSLPGFGFSEAAIIQGLGAIEMGELFVELMQNLGYYKFYMHGGDWGAFICSFIATMFPERIIGFHTNMATAFTTSAINLLVASSIYPGAIMDPALVDRVYPLTSTLEYLTENSGYLHMQSTKPDTLGIGMSDSPAGLLAWIFQGFATGSVKNSTHIEDGGISNYDLVALLDNLMVYWSSGSITSSFRIYAETFNLKTYNRGTFAVATDVPTCIIQAENEILYMPPAALNTKFTNIVNITVLDYGGHFLALTYPEIMAENIFECISKIRLSETTADE